VRSFGESLSTFPITPGKSLEATWGYAGRGSTVVIRAANPTGTLLVGVIMEAGPFSLFDERVHEGVQTSFVTDYVQVDVFRRSIANLMDRKVNKATLRGH
jgi:hypothetical protein